MFSCVLVTFPYCAPGKVWHLIVSLTHFFYLALVMHQITVYIYGVIFDCSPILNDGSVPDACLAGSTVTELGVFLAFNVCELKA